LKKRLYRFFDQVNWAQQMMQGVTRFRSLAYYRDYEEREVRGDSQEGTSVYEPQSGLVITNQTRQTESVQRDASFESEVRSGEIFIYCLSKVDTPRIREAFNAVSCVEIINVPAFLRRIEKALGGASFGGRPGHERIGHPVEYYPPDAPPGARWACPDLIACAKFDGYAWQHEYRLLFSFTDALKFENVELRIVGRKTERAVDASQHHVHQIAVGPLHDIALLHVF